MIKRNTKSQVLNYHKLAFLFFSQVYFLQIGFAACPYKCLNCSTGGCSQCEANRYFDNSQQKCLCLDGYIELSQNCYQCNYTCSKCVNSQSTCTYCNPLNHRTQIGYQCKCLDYFYDNGTAVCQSCPAYCLNCLNNQCTACSNLDFRQLVNKQCICMNGYYQLNSNRVCLACKPLCQTCQNGLSCDSCKLNTNSILQNNDCICTPNSLFNSSSGACVCISGFFLQNGVCKPCDITCKECTGSNPSQCTSCNGNTNRIPSSNAQTFTCVCKQYYYQVVNQAQCQMCHFSCLNCVGPNYDQCTLCNGNDFRQRSANTSTFKCICYDKYYSDNINSKCLPCNYSCQTCIDNNQKQSCITCNTSKYRIQIPITIPPSKNQCLCQQGYYDDNSQETCLNCYTFCKECNGPNFNQCISCNSSDFRILQSNQCPCMNGYYQYLSNKTCIKCKILCSTCMNGTQCTSCKPNSNSQFTNNDCQCIQNSIYDSTQGICICKSGFFLQNGVCQPCHISCKECTGLTDQDCTLCDSSMNRVPSNTNIKFACNCRPSYFSSPNTALCQQCNFTCQSCIGSNFDQCTQCNSSDQRLRSTNNASFQCICQDKYYSDNINSKCLSCHYSCQKCIDNNLKTSCTSCNISKNRIQLPVTNPVQKNQCLCQPGYYDDGISELCLQCHPTCKECTGPNFNQCLSCFNGFIKNPPNLLNNFSCECPVKQYINNQTSPFSCSPCHYSCKSCLGDSTINSCTDCEFTNGRIRSNSNSKFQCLCQSNTYDNGLTEKCQNCHLFCKTCVGSTLQDCTSCYLEKDFVVDPNATSSLKFQCVCKINLFYNSDIDKCVQCHPFCLSCSGIQQNNCLACNTLQNRQLLNNQCICKQGYFQYKLEQTCRKCHFSCLDCEGPSYNQCLTCDSFSFRKYNPLYKSCQCINGYFEQGNPACSLCSNPLCQICDKTNQNCFKCVNNLIIINTVSQQCGCPKEYYLNTSLSICQKCYDGCEECLGQNEGQCTKCKQNYNQNQSGATFKCFPTPPSCHYSCQTCDQNNPLKCIQCPNLRQLSALTTTNGIPTQECQCLKSYFEDIVTNQCEPCNQNCLTCIGPSSADCLQCQDLTINFRKAVPIIPTFLFSCQCQPGYYEIQNQQKCIQCHPSCLECSGKDTFCTKCPNNSFATSNGECICKEGYMYIQSVGSCQKCHQNCKTCDGIQDNQCLSCSSITRIFEFVDTKVGRCSCTFGFFEAGSIDCQQCDQRCETCVSKPEFCLSCPRFEVSKRIFLPTQNKCVCADKFVENNKGICTSCPYDCQSCDSNMNCLSCNPLDRFLDLKSNRCLCMIGTYEGIDNLCHQCDHNCKDCETSASKCTVCPQNSFLNEKYQCECVKGFYQNHQNNNMKIKQLLLDKNQQIPFNESDCSNTITRNLTAKEQLCKRCHYSCETCQEPNKCLTCSFLSQTQISNITNLCECFNGYIMIEDIKNDSFKCQKLFEIKIDSNKYSELSSLLDEIFKLSYIIVQYQVLVSLFFGQAFMAEWAFSHLFDLHLIIYYDMRNPDIINKFLSPIHKDTIIRYLSFINPFQNIGSSLESMYISEHIERYNISTNLFLESGGQIFLLILVYCISIILKQTIFHKRYTIIDQYYKVSHGRILLSRIYNIFLLKLFNSINSILSSSVLFFAFISIQDTRNIFLLPGVFIVLAVGLSHAYQIKVSQSYFKDRYGILGLNKTRKIKILLSNLKSLVTILQVLIFSSNTQLWCLVWNGVIRFILIMPLDAVIFKGSSLLKGIIIVIQLLYFLAIFTLILIISSTQQNKLNDYFIETIIKRSIVFRFLIIIMISLIQVTLLIDTISFLVKLVKSKFSYNEVLEKVIPQNQQIPPQEKQKITLTSQFCNLTTFPAKQYFITKQQFIKK